MSTPHSVQPNNSTLNTKLTLFVGFNGGNVLASPTNWDFYALKITASVQTAHAVRPADSKFAVRFAPISSLAQIKAALKRSPTPYAGKSCWAKALRLIFKMG